MPCGDCVCGAEAESDQHPVQNSDLYYYMPLVVFLPPDWSLAIHCPSCLLLVICSQLHLGIKLPFSMSSLYLCLPEHLLSTFNLFAILFYSPNHPHWLTSILLSVCLSVPGDQCNLHDIISPSIYSLLLFHTLFPFLVMVIITMSWRIYVSCVALSSCTICEWLNGTADAMNCNILYKTIIGLSPRINYDPIYDNKGRPLSTTK